MEIIIKAPKDIDCGKKQWLARYTVTGTGDARYIHIKSRSSIEVIVAKIAEDSSGSGSSYYISSPNFGVAIPSIPSLNYTDWITDQLLSNEMPPPDAVTIAEVLKKIKE